MVTEGYSNPHIQLLTMSLPLRHCISHCQDCSVDACQIYLLDHRLLSSVLENRDSSLLHRMVCDQVIIEDDHAKTRGPSTFLEYQYARDSDRKENTLFRNCVLDHLNTIGDDPSLSFAHSQCTCPASSDFVPSCGSGGTMGLAHDYKDEKKPWSPVFAT